MDKIKQLFENKYKEPLHKTSLFKPKVMILSASNIRHYVESIQDSQQDPIYSEQPKDPKKKPEKTKNTIPNDQIKHPSNHQKTNVPKNKIVTSHYLSTLFFTSKHKEKIMVMASQKIEKSRQINKKKRMSQFEELKQSSIHRITETA